MNKVRYFIDIKSQYPLSLEKKTELLADIRNTLRNFISHNPDLNISISRELTNDDIMESLRETPQHDSMKADVDNCVFYDEAQGRHKCTNPKVKSNRCYGVCNDYEDKH